MKHLILVFLLGTSLQITAQNVAYPLKLDPSHRYLVDQNNTPFLIHGDSPWSLVAQLTAGQADSYFNNQAALGFNSMIVNVVEHKFSDKPPYNVYGLLPFTNYVVNTTNWDMSSVNPDYFTNLDAILVSAGRHGIQLLLDPDFIGKYCAGAGWCADMEASGSTALYRYGQFLGKRYHNYTNVMWLNGGDASFDQAPVNALMSGILSEDTNHLALSETDGDVDGFWYTNRAWNRINTVYTWGFTSIPQFTLSEGYTSSAPVVLIEGLYEGNPQGPNGTTDLECRNQAYWALFDGACGHFYGKEPLWKFMSNWQTNLNSPGAVTLQFVKGITTSRPWYACVPDTNHTAVTSGYGFLGASTYVPVLRHTNGATLLAYITGQSGATSGLTVDLTKISGTQANCWWFNPRDGSASNLGTYGTSGGVTFATPDAHDWVLVVDDASAGFPPPGSTAPPPPPATGCANLATGVTLGWPANDFTGWQGLRLRVGNNPLTVQSLGRLFLNGNTQSHSLQVVEVASGSVLASVAWTPTGGVDKQFKYAALAAPITLASNADYYLVSEETRGGDKWYDSSTTLTTTSAGAVLSAVYSSNGKVWQTTGSFGHTYGPVDLQYCASTDSTAPSTPTGLAISSVSATQINLTWNASSDNVGVAGYQVFRDGSEMGATSGTSYSDGGLLPGTTHSYAVAAFDAAGNVSSLSAPASATTTATTTNCTTSNLVIGTKLGWPASNFTGWQGMRLHVGSLPLQVQSLGRIYMSGNTQNHPLCLVQVGTGSVVASAVWNPTGGADKQLKYASLASPVTLAANTDYDLVSAETFGGDQWYDSSTVVTTSGAAAAISAVYSSDAKTWQTTGAGGHTYGPVGLQYCGP